MNQKTSTPRRPRRSPAPRLVRGFFWRRPRPDLADAWWYALPPMERAICHDLIRGLQRTRGARLQQALQQYFDLEADIFRPARNARKRQLRQWLQDRLARMTTPASAPAAEPPPFQLAA